MRDESREVVLPRRSRKRGCPSQGYIRSTVPDTDTTSFIGYTQIFVNAAEMSDVTPQDDEIASLEIDEVGETKVTPLGFLTGGRKYSLKTFPIIGHGEKLFMLATDLARLTGYRDSYLLFLRNKLLRKVIATIYEKDDLIRQEVIPPSRRLRKISVVTARSVFMHFGHRVIVNGQRGRDDYHDETSGLQHQLTVPPAVGSMNDRSDNLPSASATAMSELNSRSPRCHFSDSKPWEGHYRPLSTSLMLQKAQEARKYNARLLDDRKQRNKQAKVR
jgi:Chromatin remodelling complex Rsc7/Swp82 subunit